MKQPLINWQELQRLNRPPMNPPPQKEEGNMWDHAADMYKQMAAMEKSYTVGFLDAFETRPTDTVLDVGCGPGRISVPMAQRAKSVTSVDSAERMLNHCIQNAKDAGVTNLVPRLLDWETAELGRDLEQHDIVIASRSVGLQDLRKLSSFARRIAVIMSWANAPSIPNILHDIFVGCSQEEDRRGPFPMDRRVGYNVTYNMVYDMGYDPNVRILTDGFTRDFSCREEAYAEMVSLGTVAPGKMDVYRSNLDRFLTQNPDGSVTFRRETRSFVMWWETDQSKVYGL
jgi:protein-L-isoaspartate O-methyltransferase